MASSRLDACHVGARFGRWLIINLEPRRDGDGARRVQCLCDCGTKRVLRSYELVANRSLSCGCLRSLIASSQNRKFGVLESAIRYRFNKYLSGARSRNLDFSLSEDEFLTVAMGDCNYCGSKPIEQRGSNNTTGSGFVANGIDRVDSALGYTISNVVPCCRVCNMAKGTMNGDEFIEMCSMVASHSNRKVGLDA